MSKEKDKVEETKETKKEQPNDLNIVLGSIKSELMTEETKTKISDLFEAVVSKKVIEIKESLSKEHEEKLLKLEKQAEAYGKYVAEYLEDKAVDYIDTEFFKEFDKYTTHCAEEYMKENKLAIDNGVKVEMFDNMVSGLRNVLVENSIPEKQVNTVDYQAKIAEQQKMLESMEKKLMESKSKTHKKDVMEVFDACTADMTLIQKNNLKKIVENYAVDDLAEFKRKLLAAKTVLKESGNSAAKAPAQKVTDKSSSVVISENTEAELPNIEEMESQEEHSEVSGSKFVRNITDKF